METEEKKEVKQTKTKKEKSLLGRIVNTVLWIVLLLWMAVCLVDFYKTNTKQEPIFTLKHETTKYDDGNVECYTGLGYKIYHYNRASYNGIQYGPFWLKDASSEK